jgi:glycosyltransferase involved in cell wall biosynthesis
MGYQKDFSNLFPVLREKMIHVHNGIDLTEMKSDCANSTPVKQEGYILSIAQQVEKKGLDILLRALQRLHQTDFPLKLLLVGDGPLRPQLQDLAGSLGISESVAFLGEKERADVVRLLNGCEVFVLPSRSEPFGIAILEAMACKKPVVATSVGGIPEIIESGQNGILVEPDNPQALAEALVTLLKNDALRKRFASNGYESVLERFSAENTGASYEAIFGDKLNSLQRQAA